MPAGGGEWGEGRVRHGRSPKASSLGPTDHAGYGGVLLDDRGMFVHEQVNAATGGWFVAGATVTVCAGVFVAPWLSVTVRETV